MPEFDSLIPQPPEAGMSDAERMLTEHRAAVRANLATDTTHAARTLRHAIERATYAHVRIPAEVLAAAAAVDRWASVVTQFLAAEKAERAAGRATLLGQQLAAERARPRLAAEGEDQ